MLAAKLRAAIGKENWGAFSGTGPILGAGDIDDRRRDVLMKAIREKPSVIDGVDSVDADSWEAVWEALKKVSDVAMQGSMAICVMAVIAL